MQNLDFRNADHAFIAEEKMKLVKQIIAFQHIDGEPDVKILNSIMDVCREALADAEKVGK
jgi:hypothetical protein